MMDTFNMDVDIAQLSEDSLDRKLRDLCVDAPVWFTRAFCFLVKDLDGLKVSLNTVQCSIHCSENLTKIENLEEDVKELKKINSEQNAYIAQLQEDHLKLATHIRRNHLIFEGIQETSSENIHEKIRTIIGDQLKIKEKISEFEAQRIGRPNHLKSGKHFKPRAVLVKFNSEQKRNLVWLAKRELKGSKIFIKEDFPKEILQRRKELLPFYLAAKNHPQVKKCFMNYDKLSINGRSYSVSETSDLPYSLSGAKTKMKRVWQLNAIAFFGKESYLSNFYACKFQDNLIKYSSSEQYYQYHKALAFGADEIANKILKTESPSTAKFLANTIPKFKESEWLAQAKTVMQKGCLLKFTQNVELREELLSTSECFIECNPKDRFFSCGLSFYDSDIKDQCKWTGKNILGIILQEVRESILKDQSRK